MQSYKDLNIDYQGGDLHINSRSLNSLEGLPEHITGNLLCIGNKLTSLVGGPQIVDGQYNCSWNNLTSLVGCASHIGDSLNLFDNPITSLVGIHKIIKNCNTIYFNFDNIKEGGIGLLMIANLTDIYGSSTDTVWPPFNIIKKYIGTGTKGMMECSKELIAKGFENYAKL